MSTYYLRLEAVNFSSFVMDSKDLSTVRGAGLLLLDAPGLVQDRFSSLKRIGTGASSGLFSFESGAEEASDLRAEVQRFLREHDQLRHATFVVDVRAASENFARDREALLVLNRDRQMKSLSLASPDFDGTSKGPCEIDGVRPGVKYDSHAPEGKRRLSESAFARRSYGRTQKRDFYRRTNLRELPEFTREFDELTSYEKDDSLNHKMAIIHIDGDGFGSILKGLCRTPADHEEFDRYLREKQIGVLRSLLEDGMNNSLWLTDDDPPRFRLETLLWGGDEIVWITPARLGWEALSLFYRSSTQPPWEFTNSKDETALLTHSAGIVFCHHQAPIHRIRRLAGDLVEEVKEHRANPNSFTYQVLESFDHLGPEGQDIRKLRSDDGTLGRLSLTGASMDQIAIQMEILRSEEYPRRKVHDMVRSVLDRTYNSAAEEEIVASDAAKMALSQLEALLGGPRMKWIHIAELWDYALLAGGRT